MAGPINLPGKSARGSARKPRANSFMERWSSLAALVSALLVVGYASRAHAACDSECTGSIACASSPSCNTCCGQDDCSTCDSAPELDGYSPLAAAALAAGGLVLSRRRRRGRTT